MKQTAIMDRIQAQMRPGIITRAGFLGEDTRKLADILVEDAAAVQRLGLTHEQFGARLRELRDAGAPGLGTPVAVPPHFDVCVDSVRGKLPCPFGDPGIIPKANTTVTNTDTGEAITYTDLTSHLIENHGFYGGRGALFRLDPTALANFLNLQAEE